MKTMLLVCLFACLLHSSRALLDGGYAKLLGAQATFESKAPQAKGR